MTSREIDKPEDVFSATVILCLCGFLRVGVFMAALLFLLSCDLSLFPMPPICEDGNHASILLMPLWFLLHGWIYDAVLQVPLIAMHFWITLSFAMNFSITELV